MTFKSNRTTNSTSNDESTVGGDCRASMTPDAKEEPVQKYVSEFSIKPLGENATATY